LTMGDIKVILVDDHSIFRKGVKHLLSDYHEIEIIAEASTGQEALQITQSLNPDVVITDISMPDMNGLDLTREIKKLNPNVNVLVLSMYQEDEYIKRSFSSGANAYLDKDCGEEEVVKAIMAVSKGKRYLNSKISEILALGSINNDEGNIELTKRELEVLKLLVDGNSNREIGERLFISTKTADTHRTNIMRKLKVNKAAELVKKVLNEGII